LFGLEQPQAAKKAVYVKRGGAPSVYTVDDSLIGKVNLSLFDLRDKTVLNFDPQKIGRVNVENHGKQYALARDPAGKWQVSRDGKSSPANGQAVQTFLEELASLKGDKIVQDPMTDPRTFRMEEPAEQITIFGKDNKQIGTVKLAQIQSTIKTPPTPAPDSDEPAPKSQAERSVVRVEDYAASSAGTAVYSLRQTDFSQFDMTADQFEETQPLGTPASKKK
jgi:hypothetical protein